jgi:Outer membrane protein beta-barrel domain
MKVTLLKYICFSILITLGLSSSAQKFYSGVGIGGQMTSASFKDTNNTKKTTTFRPGGRLYYMGRINIENNMSFTPELSYTMKGFRVKNPLTGIAEQEVILHYIEFMFLQEFSFKEKYFVKFGPSISAAFVGRDKQLSASNVRSNVPLPFNFDAWGRFEGVMNISIGTRFNGGYSLELRASKSISNIYDGDKGPKVKNILIGLSFGKYF